MPDWLQRRRDSAVGTGFVGFVDSVETFLRKHPRDCSRCTYSAAKQPFPSAEQIHIAYRMRCIAFHSTAVIETALGILYRSFFDC